MNDERGPVHAPSGTATMTAVVQDEYGEGERVLRPERIDRPAIGDGDVLVRVRAAGVDRGVWHLTAGLPYPVRLVSGLRAPKARVRGMDLAGVVEAVGRDVTGLRAGDEVFGVGDGTFAEYARSRPDTLVRKPAGLTFEQAAAIPVSGCTALQGVRDHGRVRPGQRVLVIGASGGVGTFTVQVAKALGADVTGVCSPGKVDLVRALGADRVVDYTSHDVTDGRQRYDVILDIGGNRSLTRLRRALAPSGRLVIMGGETGGRWLGGTDRQLRAMALSPFVRQHLGTFVASPTAADLAALVALVERGDLTPVVERTFALSEAAAAVRHLQDGHARGKVVLVV